MNLNETMTVPSVLSAVEHKAGAHTCKLQKKVQIECNAMCCAVCAVGSNIGHLQVPSILDDRNRGSFESESI